MAAVRRAGALALIAAVMLAAVGTVPPSGAAPSGGPAHKRVVDVNFPDPAVAPYAGGLVAVSTGPLAPRAVARNAQGHWAQTATPALSHTPTWTTSGSIWAPELVNLHGRWLLYFAARVNGLGPGGRCIGVAVSASPLGPFTPADRPLVCPAGADTRPAYDRLRPARALDATGVIDPSITGLGKRVYLLYRTQGVPSTIRMVRISPGGLIAAPTSHELLRSDHVIENPVIMRRGRTFTMLTSQGYYDRCGYLTSWRSSRHLFGWVHATPHVLLSRRNSGVCGPGGADVVRRRHGELLVFHGWVCGPQARVCPRGRDLDPDPGLDSRREMYAVSLVWRHGRPHIRPLPGPAARPAGIASRLPVFARGR